MAGQEHARHFGRKVDAQGWLDEVTASIVTGQYVAPRAGNIKFRDYAEDWRASQPHRPGTADAVRVALAKRVYPIIGDVKLSAFTPDLIQSMVKQLEGSYAASTIEVTYSYVATVFKAAVASRRIPATPCVGIKLPEKVAKRVVPLTTQQVIALVEAIPSRYRAMLILIAGTGLRRGEAFGLTRDRVNFSERRLVVNRQLLAVRHGEPHFGPPKTAASHREVPLPDVVAEALELHLESYPTGPQGLLFTAGDGTPIYKGSFWKSWQLALDKTRIKDGTRQGLHMFRHHYASVLIQAGESVKVVQTRLGHQSAQETLDTYTHLWPDSDDRTREAVDASLHLPADFLRTTRDVEAP